MRGKKLLLSVGLGVIILTSSTSLYSQYKQNKQIYILRESNKSLTASAYDKDQEIHKLRGNVASLITDNTNVKISRDEVLSDNKYLEDKIHALEHENKDGATNDVPKPKKEEHKKEFNDQTMDLFYKLVEAEGGINNLDGRIAVANVILNRYHSGKYGKTLMDVMKQKYQFEPIYNGTVYNIKATPKTIEAVNKALDGVEVIPSNCYNFWSTDLPKSNELWDDFEIIATFGDNVYAREI